MHCNGTGRSPVFLCYDQEPLLKNFNYVLFNKVKNEWGNNRHIILLNTELESEIKKEYCEYFNFYDCYYFFHALAASDWYRGYRFDCSITEPKDRKIKYKFFSLNRLTGGARLYRSIFVSKLLENNLIDYGLISYSAICPEYGHYKDNLVEGKVKYDFIPGFLDNCIKQLDKLDRQLRVDEASIISNGSQEISSITQIMQSFVQVVTETCFWENKLHLTEKIFKPIVLKQPFILLGCPNNLKYLKRYGFKTFNSWWDENYDNIVDPISRMDAVVSIINQLSNKSTAELEGMLNEMQATLDHNYNLFYSQEFVDNVWNELTTNLDTQLSLLPRTMLAGI